MKPFQAETYEMLLALAANLDYDCETGEFLWKDHYRLNTRVIGKKAGHLCKIAGYVHIRFRRRLFKAHRVAFAIHYGRWPLCHIDHINRDRADNRIVNLRECEVKENAQNKTCKAGRTGVVGVTNVTGYEGRKFIARIKLNGKNVYLGVFNSLDDAALARHSARALLHPFSIEATGNHVI